MPVVPSTDNVNVLPALITIEVPSINWLPAASTYEILLFVVANCKSKFLMAVPITFMAPPPVDDKTATDIDVMPLVPTVNDLSYFPITTCNVPVPSPLAVKVAVTVFL